jgi:hypothetical protein
LNKGEGVAALHYAMGIRIMAQASVEVKSVRASESSSEKKKAQKQSSIYVLLHALPKREKEHSWKQKVWRQQATNILWTNVSHLIATSPKENRIYEACIRVSSCRHLKLQICCS